MTGSTVCPHRGPSVTALQHWWVGSLCVLVWTQLCATFLCCSHTFQRRADNLNIAFLCSDVSSVGAPVLMGETLCYLYTCLGKLSSSLCTVKHKHQMSNHITTRVTVYLNSSRLDRNVTAFRAKEGKFCF